MVLLDMTFPSQAALTDESYPREEGAVAAAVQILHLRKASKITAERAAFITEVRQKLPGCISSKEILEMESSGVFNCRLQFIFHCLIS
jgi:hypothetical protein